MAGFLSFFARKKASSLMDDLKGLLVDADRETATEADLAQIEDKLNAISQRAAGAQIDYAREQKEADEALANYKRQYAIAQNLQERLDAAVDEATKASLTASLNTQLDTLSTAKDSVEKEKAEADQARDMRDQYQSMVQQIATRLKTRRADLKAAGMRIDKAKMSVERNNDLLEARKISDGITKGNTTVLDTMNATAAKYEKQAEAARIQTESLTTPVTPVDANIQAAMAAVDGTATPTDTKSRLASLKID